MKESNIDLDSAILDVGCGKGKLLYFLRNQGFINLFGVDPYVTEDIVDDHISICKGELKNLSGIFDLIMLHHSFEHMADPRDAFLYLSRLLAPLGKLLIRIPVANSLAWDKYRSNWAQLDAPRHFYLHSIKSIEILAKECGLRVNNVIYDSTGFQFWGSELYLKDIALVDTWGRLDTFFSEDQLASFESEADCLNIAGKGDQACFYLSHV